MSVTVRLSNAKRAAEKPNLEVLEAQRLYDQALANLEKVKEVARELGIPSFGNLFGELYTGATEINGKPSSEVLAREAGIFQSRVDRARCYVGQYTLPEGIWSSAE